MPSWLRNVLAVIAGIVVGGVANMTLITLSPSIIPLPPGVDVSDPASLSGAMSLFEPKHFLMPFLAHAANAFVGALVVSLIAASHRARLAYGIGAFTLLGGIAACFMIPAPAWFMALDLVVAYIPMAWLAIQLGNRMRPDVA